MANKRIKMIKIKDLLRYSYELNYNNTRISKTLKISRPVVIDYLKKCKSSGIEYSKIKDLSDDEILNIFENDISLTSNQRYLDLNNRFSKYVTELKKTGVTLQLLWEEYMKDTSNNPYSYSQFCYHYQIYKHSTEITMHIEHIPGDRMYVDYTGDKMKIIDFATQEEREVEIFVAILGSSSYTYVEAVFDQKKESWIKSNINAFEFFSGVTKAIVPDNLKSAVNKASKYEPEINLEYQHFSEHYKTAILPARVRKPKDKSLVEGAVKLVYQRIFAPLRNRTFYSIDELNQAIKEKLEEHNNKIMKKVKMSRYDLFLKTEKDKLGKLPEKRYEIKNIIISTIQINYHVYLPEDKHYYSVPYNLRQIDKKVKIIYDQSFVEVFHKGIRVAIHKRDKTNNGYSTKKEHMPSTHRYVSEWNPPRIINWASKIGENVKKIVEHILDSKKYPEQLYKVCLGIINLSNKYDNKRVDKACKRAIRFGTYSYKKVASILKNGYDKLEDEEEKQTSLFDDSLPSHENIRGIDSFV